MASGEATIHDVAALAGVSIATVSRVVHLQKGVSGSTRERVQRAINELNYTPNESGRALANRRHHTLGFVVPGLSGPFFGEVVQGCSEEALTHQRAVLVLSTHKLPGANRQIQSLVGRVDGIAIMGGTVSLDVIEQVKRSGKPLVLVSQHPVKDVPTVRVDNHGGTVDLVKHLISEHDYRRFAFVGTIEGSPDAQDRWNALRLTLEEAGITPPSEPIPAPFDFNAGESVARYLVQQPSLPDVLICANDQIAVGTIAALSGRGIRVPEHLAATGWDDIEISAHMVPALTTVSQPVHTLGVQTSKTLLALLNGDAVEDDFVIPTNLVTRESCGCPSPAQAALEQERSVVVHD